MYSLHFPKGKLFALPGAPMTGPAFCILRAEKLSTFGSIVGSARHTFREIPTLNADSARTHLNTTIGAQTSAEVHATIQARLPAKRRRDAVLCIEYLVTASPEWFRTASKKMQDQYFRAAVGWLRRRHGPENVVCVNMQLDETSPHLVAYVVPLTADGRLSAKDFLGGPQKLRAMQTEFAKKIGAPVGLQRGIEGSGTTHATIAEYYKALTRNPTLAAPEPPAPTITDRITGRARDMEAEHAAAVAEHVAQVEQARNVALVSQRARIQQAAAIERMRQELVTAKQEAAAAMRLREENARLRDRDRKREREFATERSGFMETIAGLKDQLRIAVQELKRMAARLLFLEDKLYPPVQNTEEQETGPIFRP